MLETIYYYKVGCPTLYKTRPPLFSATPPFSKFSVHLNSTFFAS